MEIDDEYTCDYLPGETLTIVKLYSEKHGVVQVGSSNRKIQCTHDLFDNPKLSLAHVYKGTEMIPKPKEAIIKW